MSGAAWRRSDRLKGWAAGMTPEARALRALDEFRDAFAELLTVRREPAEPAALLTLTAAAVAIGVARSTVTRWADTGRLATVGPANARRVPRGEVERLGRAETAAAER